MYYDMKRGLDARGSCRSMGIQFRLGPGDHKPVEDFLSREHTGTTAITLDTRPRVTSTMQPQPRSKRD
jgi:hypothetical protein